MISPIISAVLASAILAASQYEFSYQQYELETARGRAALYERIVQTARSECITPGRLPLNRSVKERACAKRITNEIVSTIGDQRLAALHGAASDRFAQSR